MSTIDFMIRRIPEELHRLLKHEAVDRRCTLNELIIKILENHVNTIGKDETK